VIEESNGVKKAQRLISFARAILRAAISGYGS
jgi:hypothetical protein